MDEDEISYQCLTDEQLLDTTGRLLRILEQKLERKQTLLSQKVQNLITEREKLKTINTIIDQLQGLVSSGNAQGFVFGLVTENKTWNVSSDNLFRWWNKNVKFEQNGPRVLASEISESFGLDALNDLHDTTLSSIISVLMPHCRPAQRSSPFRGETPVAWWPKGTEEWWGRVKILEDSGPPEYKKPHNLRKPAKIAVLIAILKNIEPNFSRIRMLVSDSQTLQNKMNQREHYIWLAVIRGEEIRMRLHPDYQRCSNANILRNSRIESNSCYIAGKNVKVEKIDCKGTGDKLVDIINSPSIEKGENSSENKKKIIAGKEQVINTGSSASTRLQGSLSILTKVDEPEAVNDMKNSNEEFIANSEKVPVSKNNFPTCSQSSFLVKDTAKKSENIKKRKLKGIVNPDPKRLKLPHQTYASGWSSHDMQGPLSESTVSFDEIMRSKKSKEIVIGIEAIKLPNKCNNNAGQSSCGTVHGSIQEYQVQTNNFDTNPCSISANKYNLSKNKTSQSYDSLTSFSAPIRAQVDAFSSNSLIPHDQSMNQYTTEKGSVSMDSQTKYGSPNLTSLSISGDHPCVERSFQPNTSVAESYKVENYETNKMGRSAFTEPGAIGKSPNSTSTQGSIDNKNHDFQFQTNYSTFYPSSTSANNFDLGNNITYQTTASYLVPTRGQNTTFNLTDAVKSLNYSNTANHSLTNHNPQTQYQLPLDSTKPGSVNINPQSQNQLNLVSKEQGSVSMHSQTKYGSPNLTSLSITGDHLSVECSFQPNTSVAESYKVENYETNKMGRSAFTEPGTVCKSPNSTSTQGFIDNKNRDFQFQNNSTFYQSSTSANNFDLGNNITYQTTASYLVPTRGQNTTFNLTDAVKSLNYSYTANHSLTNHNPQTQHQLPLDSTKPVYHLQYHHYPGSVNINPRPQDQLNLVSNEQGSRDSKPQFQNQFESGSSCYPILESSHSQITNSEWLSNSSVSNQQGSNDREDLDSEKNKDVEKTMDIENAMDSDAAAESGQRNFESDDLAAQLRAFHALDSINSNNLDGIF